MPVPSDNLINITDRPNYYAGQYLLEDDFELEQQYHVDRLRRHHRLLHVAGIVHGLEVSWVDSPTNTKLQVTAGTAIDADGRQIVLAQNKADIAIPTPIAANGSILYIRYESSELSTQGTATTQPATSSATGSAAATTTPAPTPTEGKNRIKEDPVIGWETTVPTGAIALIQVMPNKELSFSDRIYSGIRFPSPRNTQGQGLTLRYKGNGQPPTGTQLELAEFTGNLSVTGTLAVTGTSTLTGNVSMGGTLAVTGTSTLTGNVSMSGTLAVTGTSTIGNNSNASFMLAPSDASPNAGYIRFGDNTGWKLHFARSKENGSGTLNTGTTGTLMTIQDNGNVGIGTTTTVTEKLEVSGNIKILGARLKSKDGYGMLEADKIDWLRINPDESYSKIALYKPVAIGTGGLAIGEWTEQSPGVLKVTKSAYFATTDGKVGIGTLEPREILDVGDFALTASNAYLRIKTQGGNRFKAGIKLQHFNEGFGALLESDETTNYFRIKGYSFGIEKDLLSIKTDGDGNVGIGTPNPQAKLDVRGSTNGTGTIASSTTTVTGTGTQFQTQLKVENLITATYTSGGTSYTESRRITAITSNTSLTINSAFTANIPAGTSFTFQSPVLLVQNGGNVGIGTTTPESKLHMDKGRVDITASDATGGGQNRFDGLQSRTGEAGRRSQLVLSSGYSDLVIASSYSNGVHGSTLTFATYNPADATQYRKWVINQGNWGDRKQFLEFGYSDANGRANPHDSINDTDTALTLDGINKRVGIGTRTPSDKLEVNGNLKATNATLTGTLSVTGASTLTGNVSMGGTLAVTGTSTLTGNVSMGGDINVGGAAMLGYESNITDFGSTLKSGFYQNGGQEITGDVPDTDHVWTHLITARHFNTGNNHQLQIAASYAANDRLFFRKIRDNTPSWNEVATRAANTFSGNQTINGSIKASGGLQVGGYMLGTNRMSIDQDYPYRGYLSTTMKSILNGETNGSFVVFGPTVDFSNHIMFFWKGYDGKVYRGHFAGELIG